METLTSSVEASIESGRDTSLFEYTHEYSTDNGVTWIPVPLGMTLDNLRDVRAVSNIAVPQVHPYDGELSAPDYDEREDYVIKTLVPQSDPNEPLPYETHDAQLNSDGLIKVLSCGFGASGYSPGGVSWIPPTSQQERKAKWRKRFRMKGRKNA